MVDLLFVCGTLRSEFDNPFARRLRAEARLMGRGATIGSIFRIGWFPGFKLEPSGEVHGEIYHLADPAATLLKVLDEYEGPEFERVIVTCSTVTCSTVKCRTVAGSAVECSDVEGQAGGVACSAWIYRYLPEPPPDSRIPSGDFCAP